MPNISKNWGEIGFLVLTYINEVVYDKYKVIEKKDKIEEIGKFNEKKLKKAEGAIFLINKKVSKTLNNG